MAASLDSVVVRRALLGGALVLPFIVVAAYLLISRQDLEFSAAGDYVALFIAIGMGAGCLWQFAGHAQWRPIAIILYSLVCFAAVLMFFFSFVCAVFEECL